LGDGLYGGMATAISRFTGMGPDAIKSLLAYLAPVVIGRVASQWQNHGGTPAALKAMFADQKRNIEDALPAGFSLSDVSGIGRIGDAGRSAAQAARTAENATRSLASTLIPLVLLVGGAILIWTLWRTRPQPQRAEVQPTTNDAKEVVAMKPVAPDATAVPQAVAMPEIGGLEQQWTDMFGSLNKAFAGIKDNASAEAAIPQLEKLEPQLDELDATWQRLPATGRMTLTSFLGENITKIKEQAEQILALPGLADRVKALIGEIVRKLGDIPLAPPPT
jgi:hypothetical protein